LRCFLEVLGFLRCEELVIEQGAAMHIPEQEA
jgi:hypothetical protein